MRSRVVVAFALVMAATGIARSSASTDSAARGSLRKMFGDSISVVPETVRLSQDQKDTIALHSRTRWLGDSVRVLRCLAHGKAAGYGFLDEVYGKTQLITYLVGLKPDGTVNDVDILVYRESYGGEISYESFRKQFRDKSARDRLTPGRDIKNISGATISVRAITDGVKRILATFNLLRHQLER
jgi:Na+-translocating ferredoxin:NAD+ oxidoreductase RnfG subunit